MLDNIDIEILKILQTDANTTTRELSQRLHLTTTPIHERIKRLEKDGYIQKYVAILNKQKLKGTSKSPFCYLAIHMASVYQFFASNK